MDLKEKHYGSWKYYKSCYFYNFSSPNFKKHTITFFVIVLLIFFMRKKLTDDIVAFSSWNLDVVVF